MLLNGFTAFDSPKWGVYRVPGTSISLLVRREIAPLLIGFAAEFHQLVEPLHKGWCWGAAARLVRGRSNVSMHAAGLAIDLNAPRHPLGRTGTFAPRQKATIRALCRKYGLRWGGDFKGRRDEMHVEVILKRAAALALVAKLQAPRAPRTRPAAKPRLAKLRYGARNSDVVLLQQRLNKVVGSHLDTDGIYGPKTKAAVRVFQRRQGWRGEDADGLPGPITLRRLFA